MNLRTLALSTFALISTATVIAMYHWKADSETTLSEARVTAKILDEARADARTDNKYLMVEFGAGWCSDCLALSQALETPVLRDLLKKHFVVMNVDVGQFNRNIDIAVSLGVDVNEGIPTAVFLGPGGDVLARKLGTNQILAYLQSVIDRPQTTIR